MNATTVLKYIYIGIGTISLWRANTDRLRLGIRIVNARSESSIISLYKRSRQSDRTI